MQCPICEWIINWDWLEDECIEPKEIFQCPHCEETLRYEVDEDTDYSAQHITIELIDD